MKATYHAIVSFHGHTCPGLAIGYRMARAALGALEVRKAMDEELVAIVENDACGVDALQCLTGCTFGKGNLIFKNYGKQAYTLFSRSSKRAVRVVFSPPRLPASIRRDRSKYTAWLLAADQRRIITVQRVVLAEPSPARAMASVVCDLCQEAVMKTRTRAVQNRTLCIPCARQQRKRPARKR